MKNFIKKHFPNFLILTIAFTSLIKKIFKIIKNLIGEILILIGSGLFIHNIFDFSYSLESKRPIFGYGAGVIHGIYGIAYYYNYKVLNLITLGFIFIVTGILILINRRK